MRVLLAIAIAGLWIGSSSAQPSQCIRYVMDQTNLPQIAREYLIRSGDAALYACTVGRSERYLSATAAKKTGSVCVYHLRELRVVNADGLTTLTVDVDQPSTTYMTLANRACPATASPPYTAVRRMSTAAFERLAGTLLSSWSSDGEFDEFFASLPTGVRESREFVSFRDFVLYDEAWANNIVEISLERDLGVYVRYRIQVRMPEDSSKSFVISVTRLIWSIYTAADFGISID